MTLPSSFKHIRLELARTRDFPNGSASHGYEFVAPLDGNAHIDPALWQTNREHCRVHRFWGSEEDNGYLLHKPGGPEHARWVFDYDNRAEYDDEAGVRFGAHPFRQGDYVSIVDESGDTHPFRVVSVVPVS